MENVDTKKKIKGLPSTIVAGIFISISLIFAIILLCMNLKGAEEAYMEAVQESTDSSEDPAAAAIAAGFAGMFGLMFIIVGHYLMVIIPFVISHFMLIPVIKNLKHTDNKAIKIINFVYLGLIVAIVLVCLIKFILFVTHVG